MQARPGDGGGGPVLGGWGLAAGFGAGASVLGAGFFASPPPSFPVPNRPPSPNPPSPSPLDPPKPARNLPQPAAPPPDARAPHVRAPPPRRRRRGHRARRGLQPRAGGVAGRRGAGGRPLLQHAGQDHGHPLHDAGLAGAGAFCVSGGWGIFVACFWGWGRKGGRAEAREEWEVHARQKLSLGFLTLPPLNTLNPPPPGHLLCQR